MSDRKRVLVVCQLDGFSNGVKPREIERFLKRNGHDVHLIDTYYLTKARTPSAYALLAIGLVWSFLRRLTFVGRPLHYYVLQANYRLRRRVLLSKVRLDNFDLVICETFLDSGLLLDKTSAHTILDLPIPWADENYHEGQVTAKQHAKLRRLETAVYTKVDTLSFWSESYIPYVLDEYGIEGSNLITLKYGCRPSPRRARFSASPRIVYLGSLWQKAVDLPLLGRLTRLYPIDVYGGPAPDPALGLNYLGWAPPEVLEEYQLGLITIASRQAQARLHSFSAKHPQYLAYGLPVLVPPARSQPDLLLAGSVPYDEESFLGVVETLSDESEWRRWSDEAYAQAQRLSWDETLQPLEVLLQGLPSPAGHASTTV